MVKAWLACQDNRPGIGRRRGWGIDWSGARACFALIAVVVATLGAWGCATREAGQGHWSDAVPQPLTGDDAGPGYTELVNRYNQSIEALDRLWSRAVVEITWTDDEGKHFEQGEGNVILALPDGVAFSVGKLGHTMFWTGANRRLYWLFDLREEGVVYAGRRRYAGLSKGGRLPIPVRPMDLPRALGLVKINPEALPAQPQVEWYDGGYLIEPPNTRSRLLLAPKTCRPKRIDLLDEEGRSRVISRLTGWEPVRVEGLAPGQYPYAPTRVEISLVDRDGLVTLHLSDLSDGREGSRVNERIFDLQHLVRALKPSEKVDLDRSDAGGGSQGGKGE